MRDFLPKGVAWFSRSSPMKSKWGSIVPWNHHERRVERTRTKTKRMRPRANSFIVLTMLPYRSIFLSLKNKKQKNKRRMSPDIRQVPKRGLSWITYIVLKKRVTFQGLHVASQLQLRKCADGIYGTACFSLHEGRLQRGESISWHLRAPHREHVDC